MLKKAISKVTANQEIALKTIGQLPADASWEDIQERINFIVAVRKGLRELDEGKCIDHDKIKEERPTWAIRFWQAHPTA